MLRQVGVCGHCDTTLANNAQTDRKQDCSFRYPPLSVARYSFVHLSELDLIICALMNEWFICERGRRLVYIISSINEKLVTNNILLAQMFLPLRQMAPTIRQSDYNNMFNHWVVPINSRCSSFLGNIVEWNIINTNSTTITVSRHTVLQPPRMRGH